MLPLRKAETTHRSYTTHQFCKQFQLLTALHTDEVREAVEHWRGENVVPLHRVHAHSESEVKLTEQVTVVPQSFSLHFVKAVCVCSTVTCQTPRTLSNWILWIEFTGYSYQKNILPALLSTIKPRPCLSSWYGTRVVLDTVVKMPDKNTSWDFLTLTRQPSLHFLISLVKCMYVQLYVCIKTVLIKMKTNILALLGFSLSLR